MARANVPTEPEMEGTGGLPASPQGADHSLEMLFSEMDRLEHQLNRLGDDMDRIMRPADQPLSAPTSEDVQTSSPHRFRLEQLYERMQNASETVIEYIERIDL